MGKDLKIGMSFDIDWKKTYNEAREGFREMSKDFSSELVDAVMDAFEKINKASAFGADLSSLYETLTRDITNANGDAKLIASATKMFDARIKFLSDLNKKIFEDTKIENATDGLTKSQVKQLMDLYEVRIDQENKVKKYKASSYKTEVYNENGFEDLASISNYFRPKNKKNTYTDRILKFVKDNSKKYGITDDIAKNLETPLKEYANLLDVLDSVKNRNVKENSIEAVKQQRAIEFLVKEINSQTSSNALLKDFNENELKITLPDPQEVWKAISGYVEKQVQSVLSNTSWRREAINKVVSFRNQNLRNAERNNEKIIQASKNINNNKADDSNSGNKGGNGSSNGSVGNGSVPPNQGANQDYKNKYFIKTLEEVSEKFLFAAQQFNQSYGDSKFTKDETKDIFKDAIAYLARYEDLGGNKENLIDKTGLPNIIKGLFKKGFSGESQIVNGVNGLPNQLKEIINSVHALKDIQEDVVKNEGTIGDQTNNAGNNNKGSDNQENNDKGNNNRNDNVAKNNDRDTNGDNQGFGISDESANQIITELSNIKQAINECKDGIVDELKNDINTSISSISEKLGGDNKIDNSQLERIITEIAGLGDKLEKLNSIPNDIKDNVIKSYGNAADVILNQIAANNLMSKNAISLRERSIFFDKNGNMSNPFFEGEAHSVNSMLIAKEILKTGKKYEYENHTHSDNYATMSFPGYRDGEKISGDIASFYQKHKMDIGIEEQLISGLNSIQVFMAKDFFEHYEKIISDANFEDAFADAEKQIEENKESIDYKTIELNALKLFGIFDVSNIETSFNGKNKLQNILTQNANKYIDCLMDNLTEGAVEQLNGTMVKYDFDKLLPLMKADGLEEDDAKKAIDLLKKRLQYVRHGGASKDFSKAFEDAENEYILSKNFGITDYRDYITRYDLNNEEHVKAFKEKYGFDARMINEIQQDSKQESSNLNPLSSSLDEVIEKIKEKNDLFNEEQSIVSTITESEVNDLNKVRDAVNEISEAVERKNELVNNSTTLPPSESISNGNDAGDGYVEDMHESVSEVKDVAEEMVDISTSDNIVKFVQKNKREMEELGDGTVRVLSDIGMAYEDFFEMVRKESLDKTHSSKERLAFVRDGKIVESLQGQWGQLTIPDNVYNDTVDKIVHSHPNTPTGLAFSDEDITEFLFKYITTGISKKFELISRGNTIDFDVSGMRQEMIGYVVAGLLNIIKLTGEQLNVGGLIPEKNSNEFSALYNILFKGLIEKYGGRYSTSLNLGDMISDLDANGIDVNNYFAMLESLAQFTYKNKALPEDASHIFKMKTIEKDIKNGVKYENDDATFIQVFRNKEEAVESFTNAYEKIIDLYKIADNISSGDFEKQQEIFEKLKLIENQIGFNLFMINGKNKNEKGFNDALNLYLTNLGYNDQIDDVDQQLTKESMKEMISTFSIDEIKEMGNIYRSFARGLISINDAINSAIDSIKNSKINEDILFSAYNAITDESLMPQNTLNNFIEDDDDILDLLDNFEDAYDRFVKSIISQSKGLTDETHKSFYDWENEINSIISDFPIFTNAAKNFSDVTSYSTSLEEATEKFHNDLEDEFLQSHGHFLESRGVVEEISNNTKEALGGALPDNSFIDKETFSIKELNEELSKLLELINNDGRYNVLHRKQNIVDYLSALFPTSNDTNAMYEAINAHIVNPSGMTNDLLLKNISGLFLQNFYNDFDEMKLFRDKLFEDFNDKKMSFDQSIVPPFTTQTFEDMAKEEIEYTKNQIKGFKDYIFNTNSDECGLFAKYLFGEDGNLKTEKQVIAELETMIDEFYKGTRTDTEEIFRLWRAAESTNLLKGYKFDYKWMRPSFEEWRGNHDDTNQWLTQTDGMSDEAHSMLGHLVEEEEKLSILQKNNGEDFVNYLKEAKELSKEIYQLLDKYKDYSPSDKDSILDSDITQEQAKEKGDLLEKESDKADDLIKKYETLIEKYSEFKKNRNISYIENDPLGKYGITNDLKDLSDKLFKESGIYSDISLLRHARKIKSQLDVYENDTRIDRAYNDNKLYPIAEGIDTEIYRGAISAQEGIEKFIAKAKELGYEFDEVTEKWIRFENEISSSEYDSDKIKDSSEIDLSNNNIIEFKNVQEEISSPDLRNGYEKLSDHISELGDEYHKSEKYANDFLHAIQDVQDIQKLDVIDDSLFSHMQELYDKFPEMKDFFDQYPQYLTGWVDEDSLDDWFTFLEKIPKAKEFLKFQDTLADFVDYDEKVSNGNVDFDDEYLDEINGRLQELTGLEENFIEKYKEIINLFLSGEMSEVQTLKSILEKEIPYLNYFADEDYGTIKALPKSPKKTSAIDGKVIDASKLFGKKNNNEFVELEQDDIIYDTVIDSTNRLNDAEQELIETQKELNNVQEQSPISDTTNNQFNNLLQNETTIDTTPTLLDVKPNLTPEKFAKEVTDLLDGHSAEINVEPSPNLNAKEFTDKVTTLLSGHAVSIDVELNNSKSQESINEESIKFDSLGNSLDEVTHKVDEKTMAFVNEKAEVERVVDIEKNRLNELKESVESVSNSVNDLTQGLKGVSEYANNTIKLEVTNKDSNKNTASNSNNKNSSNKTPSSTSSTSDGLNNDTILNEQAFSLNELKAKNKEVEKLEKSLGGVLDVVKQIRKGNDGDYVSFRLTGENGSAWVGANGTVLRQTTKESSAYSDKKAKEKQDKKDAKEIFDLVDKQKKAKEKETAITKKEQEKQEKERQKIIEQGNKKIQQREEARQKRLNKMSMDQAKGDAKRRINALETASKLSSSENKYFTDSYYKNLFESQVGQSATATFKDQKDATHWQGALVENEMKVIIDAQSKLIAAEKEFDKVKKNFDNDSVTYADRYKEVIENLQNARNEFEKLNADEFYKGNKIGISNDLVEKYEKQNTTLKDTLLARESRNNSNNVEGDTNDVLKKRKERILKLIEMFDVYYAKLDSYPDHADKIRQTHEQLELFQETSPDLISDDQLNNIDRFGKSLRNIDKLAKENKVEKLIGKITEFMTRNSRMSRESASEFQNLIDELRSGDLLESEIDDISTSFEKLKTKIRNAGETGRNFFDIFKRKILTVTAQQIATYFSFNDIIRYARTAVQTIMELDTALVDLQKTTKMNNTELNEFYFESTGIAKSMGVTTKEIIDQAAAWSRLGYNTKDASETMAELSSQFASISPGMDIDSATDGLVSTMKAFDVEVEDVERKIMDNINRIGNTAATSNSEIVDMLTRSSAAMAAANNSIEETIALETAAVEITRNAETTGTAFKTIAMRIRGYDEETEELSDDLQNISGDIANLTKVAGKGGVSLFTDETKQTYKSTYQILKEISEIWDQISDKQQAELLEKLAGKRGGQVVAGLLSNFEAAEKAMMEMEGAAGSADAEMSIIKKSINFKLNELKETWVDTFKYIIGRDDIGNIISSATALSEVLSGLIKNVGILGSAGGAFGFATGLMNKGPIATKQIGDEQLIDAFGIRSNLYKRKLKNQRLSDLQGGIVGLEKYREYEEILKLTPKDQKAWGKAWEESFGDCVDEVKKLANGLKDGTKSSDEFEQSLNGVISSVQESTKDVKLSTNLFNGFKDILKGIANGIVIGAISFGIEKLVSAVYELATVDDKVAELANEASTSIQKTNSSIDEYKTKLKDLNKTIHSNSSTEKEIYNARKEMLDLQNSLVETFGEEAEGINLVTMSYERQIEVLNELQMKKNEEDLRRFDSKGGWANDLSNWANGYSGNIERLEKEYFGNRTVTLHMSADPFSKDLKVSDEYINKIKDIGAEFKKTTIAIDGLGDKVLSLGTSDYVRNTINTLNARDLQEGESVKLEDMIQFSGTAKEIYDQIMDVKRVIGNDDTFKYLNKQLDELAQKYGKLIDEYDDIAKQHVLNDYIFSDADENTYDEFFDRLTVIKGNYQKALLSGNEDDMKQVVEDYNQLKKEIEDEDLEMFDEAAEDQIKNWFKDAGKDIQSTVDEWDIKLKIKDIDVSSIKNKTKDEILKAETYESTKDKLTEEFDKAEKELREKFDKAKDDADLFYKYMWTGDESKEDLANNRVLQEMGGDFETLLAEQKDKIVEELGLTAEEYKFICKNIEDGTYDTLNAIHAETEDTSKALDVLKIKSEEALAEEGKLTKTIVDSAKTTKDSIESISTTLEKLKSGKLTSSEIIDFLSNDDNTEFIQSATNLEEALINKRNSLRKAQLDNLKELSTEERKYWENVTNDAYDQAEFVAHLNQTNAEIDDLQNGLETLSSAFDEYNQKGYITVDTLQSLLTVDSNYLQMLTVENGQIKINMELYKQQVAEKMKDFKVSLDEAAAKEINALAEQNSSNEIANNTSLLKENSIALSENTKEATKNALKKGVDKADIDKIIGKYDAIYNAALKGLSKNFKDSMGLTTQSGSEALSNFIAVQDAMLDAGKISFADYCTNVKGKIEDMYRSGKITAKEYFDAIKTFLEKQQSIYDKILNAVTRRFDKEIESIDKQITAINKENDALNKQKDEYDKILSVVQEVYDKEIESLHDQQDAIQDKIDALQKANDEEDRALALANARYALEKAQQQRTRLVYNGAEGFVYQTDPEAIRDAKKELKDVELENTISALEEEKEALDKNIETLEEYKEKWSEVSETYDKEVNRQLAIALWGENYEQMILQNREQDIQDFTDKYVELQRKADDNTKLIESLEEKKQVYEELKKEWQDITSVYEQSIEDQLAKEYLGANWEAEILSGRKNALEQFKNDYVSIQEQIREAAIKSAEAQERAAAAGSGNTGSIPNETSETNKIRQAIIVESDKEGVKSEFSSMKDANDYIKSEISKSGNAKEVYEWQARVIDSLKGYGVYDESDKHYSKPVKQFDTIDEAQKFIDDNWKDGRKWKIRAIQAFAKGGVINANNNNPLNSIASKLGEDTAVLARHGERILTPVQNQYWEKWTNAIPNLTKHLEKLKFNTPNLSSILNAVASKETTVKQEISISLPNVTNTSGAEYVLNALKTLPLEAVQRVNRR